MKLQANDEEGVQMRVSWDELAIMNYAIGDTVQKTDRWEFPVLVGASVELAKTLRDEIRKALELEPTSEQG